MFTKGFKKLAWGDGSTAPKMPSAEAAAGVRKGMAEGQTLSKGWANMKSELGGLFGSNTKDTGKMGG